MILAKIPDIFYFFTIMVTGTAGTWLSGRALVRFGRSSPYFTINLFMYYLSAALMLFSAVIYLIYGR